MTRRLISLLALAALAACATGAQPRLAAPLKDVTTADQGRYWLVDQDSIGKGVPSENGCFRVSAIIDSDGKLFQPKVLAMVGPDLSGWLPGFLAALRFQPAPGNTARTPIRTVLTWTLTRSVTTVTVPAGSSAAAAVAAAAHAAPPAADPAWGRECQAKMDAQMGIKPATTPPDAH